MLIISGCLETTIPNIQPPAPSRQTSQVQPIMAQQRHAATAPPEQDEGAAGAVFELPTPTPLCAKITALQSLHLRATPNEKAGVIDYLYFDEQVEVITYGIWWYIKTERGTLGYANARYLKSTVCKQ